MVVGDGVFLEGCESWFFQSGGVRCCQLTYDLVIIVRYASLVIRVDRFMVVVDFHEVGDGFSAVRKLISVSVTFPTYRDVVLIFPLNMDQVFVQRGPGYVWWRYTAAWGGRGSLKGGSNKFNILLLWRTDLSEVMIQGFQ